ncbi:MAG: hypothetical protein ABJF10_26120, partial [Chthoniobacter sp.]|uniref:hypothetical protein n=1 Tax=Chthoniobacter sp. TaxID=2510640 RepID=UPI0032ACB1B3
MQWRVTITRRFPRVLRLGGLVFLAGLLLLGGAAWWAHSHLTKLLVASFNRACPELMLSARTAAFSYSLATARPGTSWSLK